MDAADRRRYERDRNLMAIRKAERGMATELRTLELKLEAFEAHLGEAERSIDEELRAEHFGHEPEHRPFWRDGSAGKHQERGHFDGRRRRTAAR